MFNDEFIKELWTYADEVRMVEHPWFKGIAEHRWTRGNYSWRSAALPEGAHQPDLLRLHRYQRGGRQVVSDHGYGARELYGRAFGAALTR